MSDKLKFRFITKTTLVPAIILLVAAVCGSISAGRISEEQCGNLSGYLVNFFENVPGVDKGIIYSGLKKQIAVWFFIAVSGWVLPGFLMNVATVCERGFVIGYTSAGFFRVYGLSGIKACAALIPEMLLYIPLLTFFSSISLKMSFLSHENKKNFLGKYVLTALFFLSVFCAVSVFQSFLTTTFMQWISKEM